MLRALGLTPRQQARIRSTELAGAVAAGGVIGLVSGAIAVLLTVGDLARSATPGRPAAVEPATSLAVPGLALLVILLGVAVLAVAARQSRHIRRDATRTSREGD